MIKNYNEFSEFNEGLNWKKALVGTAIAGAVGYGAYDYVQNVGKANLDKVETIGDTNFKDYTLTTTDNVFDLRINNEIIVSNHSYTEGSDKDSHTVSITNIIMPDSVKEFWYKNTVFHGTYASSKEFPKSTKIELNTLKIYKETPTYTIYRSKKFFSPFNYLIVTKGHKEGEEYKLTDCSLGTYVCDRINRDIYILSLKGMGSGNMGGAGAGRAAAAIAAVFLIAWIVQQTLPGRLHKEQRRILK